MKVWIRLNKVQTGFLNETFDAFSNLETEKMIQKDVKLDLMRDKKIVGQINIFPIKKGKQNGVISVETSSEEVGKVEEGPWPVDDLRRAFVEGAKWWEWESRNATIWPSDQDTAEAEAERRYPGGTPSGALKRSDEEMRKIYAAQQREKEK